MIRKYYEKFMRVRRCAACDGARLNAQALAVRLAGLNLHELGERPIADALRSILDGHINLTRDLSTQNHYPAIDVLGSISRVMDDIVDSEHRRCANKLKETLAAYRKAEDLINIGAYVTGSNPKIDYAIEMIEKINNYLRQDIDETTDFDESISRLAQLFAS